MKQLQLTEAEAKALREKLQWLMDQANGVDIWLAPGGGEPEVDCFLDCDDEEHYRLGTILQKLGGNYMPHRDEGDFKKPITM